MKPKSLISWSGNVQTQAPNFVSGKVNEEKKYLLELEKFTFVFGEKLTFNLSCQLEASISVLGGLSPDFDACLQYPSDIQNHSHVIRNFFCITLFNKNLLKTSGTTAALYHHHHHH